MTAVANSVYTAAQFNTFVRDNLNETAPAKATTTGTIFVGTGVNSIAERVPSHTVVQSAETTTSMSYTDLATVGPAVTVDTGSAAFICIRTLLQNNTAGQTSEASFAISGASSAAPTVARAISHESSTANAGTRVSLQNLFTTLTPGSNTFTMKYLVDGGTGLFSHRELIVIPL